MEMHLNPEFQHNLRDGIISLMSSEPELFRPLVEDVIEDYLLGEIMSEPDETVDRKLVMDYLNENRV
jgi:hypothetical protein